MHLVTAHRVSKLAGDSLGFGNFLRLEALSLEHVEEIGIPAKVELIGPIQFDATLSKKVSKHAMNNRRASAEYCSKRVRCRKVASGLVGFVLSVGNLSTAAGANSFAPS